MFAGTKITIDGQEYIVPPLSLGQLRNGALELLREHDALVADGKIFDSVIVRGKVIAMALSRNYPKFEEKLLFDYLDMQNSSELWLRVLGASGFTPGEVEAVGAK